MSSSSVCMLLLVLVPVIASGSNFLGANPELAAAAVREELRGVLDEVLGHGHGVDSTRLTKIRTALEPQFRVLPKNRGGRISAPVMRYVVQRYFSHRHGWIVKGFEPHAIATNASEVRDGDHILQSKLPGYVRSALEEKFSHDGFALEDLSVMIAAVERLVFDEVIRIVEHSYRLNSLPTTQALSWESLTDVLTSAHIIGMLEGDAFDVSQHQSDKDNINEIYPHWDTTLPFLLDVAENDAFQRRNTVNPFADKSYSFEDATRVTQQISEEFGPWSNHECLEMKDRLSAMDVHETGRVKASDFYRKEDGVWQFSEVPAYLRELGALDESSPVHGPQVIIPNYIAGMSNCITSTPYYSVCCLNECDMVFEHLEAAITKPMASSADILQAVESMHLFNGNISASLRARLEEIVAHHGGTVPLHGRLLAQWLHYAFPRECPYPHTEGAVNPQTPMKWEATVGDAGLAAAGNEIEEFLKSEAAQHAASPDAGLEMWNSEEVLLLTSTPSDVVAAERWSSILRVSALLGMIAAIGALVVKEATRVMSFVSPKAKMVEYDV